jgi:hypothetical protein
MRNYLAQTQTDIGNPLRGIGPLGLEGGEDAPSVFAQLVSTAIGLMTVIAAVWFIFVLITGAIGIISSGGDKAAYEAARKRITTGIIGIAVVVAAVFIIDLVATLLGIPSILNIQSVIQSLSP